MLETRDTTSRQTWQNVNSNQPGSRSKTLSYDHNRLAFLLPVLHRAMHISKSSCHLSAACGALTSLYDILYKSISPVYCSSVNLCKCLTICPSNVLYRGLKENTYSSIFFYTLFYFILFYSILRLQRIQNVQEGKKKGKRHQKKETSNF